MRLRILLFLAAAFLLTGCAHKMIVSEVLQSPEQAPIYTRYNLWPGKRSAQSSLFVTVYLAILFLFTSASALYGPTCQNFRFQCS